MIRLNTMTMKYNEFNNLHKQEQFEALWNKGFVIGERKKDRYSYILYSIDKFYVELRYFNELLHGFQIGRDRKDFELYDNAIPLLIPGK